ncbi:MAG: hypothetical protein M9904_00155 [Chitinophagaceae bacterium]|nr:hypothetical protein [Chitinophagaceae bacterium]
MFTLRDWHCMMCRDGPGSPQSQLQAILCRLEQVYEFEVIFLILGAAYAGTPPQPEQQNQHNILAQSEQWGNKTDKARNKKHEVFEPSFDHKECVSADFTE